MYYEILEINDYKDKNYKKYNNKDLFDFINNKENISNKNIKNDLIWNLFYLRKIFNKSENFYRNISQYKYKSNYIYIIFDKNTTQNNTQNNTPKNNSEQDNNVKKILGIFTIIIDKNIPIKMCEISFLLNKSFIDTIFEHNNTLLNSIIHLFRQDNIKNQNNNLFFTYMDSRETKLNDYIKNNYFTLSFIDKLTYNYNNNIYYQSNTDNTDNIEFSQEVINNLLQEYYYLTDDINKDYDSLVNTTYSTDAKHKLNTGKTIKNIHKSLKLSKSSIKSSIKPSMKTHLSITKHINDIENIDNILEIKDKARYDYRIIYLVFSIHIIFLLNEYDYSKNIKALIMERYFKYPKLFNKHLYTFYYTIYDYMKKIMGYLK